MKPEPKLDPELILALTAQVPPGRLTTYGTLARLAGRPGAARAVGQVLKRNPDPEKVPCYRVVRSDGRLGGYHGSSLAGIERKTARIQADGIEIIPGPEPRVRDLERFLFKAFRPLKRSSINRL
ncbi:MAG: Methylated-DNA--protein-cysteine methyltransferase [candidate division TA06 bacterium ADurb.Bin417]|uniref:Methylated-DNA--protein-cysteine methyltransferase n=1 Tax=candidate division TA06 bacterium ADurb.Bin417 TaxID=1852828 RepID=A0A1V5M8T6_UNCT6|nr:MAG: Methylated-DNA--protein-cysteine methyltransferase [candidate division TA06 bacterium ADurb.Bin417]